MSTTSGGERIELGTVEQDATYSKSKSYYARPQKLTENQEKVLQDIYSFLDSNCDSAKEFETRKSFNEKVEKSGDMIYIWNELLRRVVKTRNNKFIIGVLIFIQDCLSNSRAEINDPASMETIEMVCLRAIILLTINSDSENLEAVLTWKKENSISFKQLPEDEVSYPLQLASNEDYTFCMRALYKDGCNIQIDPEDKKNIYKLMMFDWGVGTFKATRFLRFFDFCSDNNINDDLYSLWLIQSKKYMFDPIQRVMTLSAIANPDFISIAYEENQKSESDPLRTAFAYATYAEYLARNNPQHSNQFQKISNKCEEFCTELLNNCQNNSEIEILLQDKALEPTMENKDQAGSIHSSYTPSQSGDHWVQTDVCQENRNWNLALWEGHKSFVSHPYFQEFINRKMWPSCNKKRVGFSCIFWDILLAIILLFLYPLITIVDLLFRDADILFLNQKHPKMGEKRENFIFSFFRNRIHQPSYRIIVDALFDVLFLVNLIWIIWDPENTIGKPEMEWYDYTFVYLVFSYLIDDIIEIFRSPQSFWKRYAFLTHFCFFAGYILQGVGFYGKTSNDKALASGLSGNDPILIGTAFICIAGTAAMYGLVNWLLLFKTTGPVVVGLSKVFNDVVVVVYLLVIVFAAFLISFNGMFSIYHDQHRRFNYTLNSKHHDLETPMKAVPAMLWSIVDPEAIPMIKRKITKYVTNGNSTSTSTELVDSWEFYHLMAMFMCLVSHILIAIILTNLLITLMNATYTKFSINSNMYWIFNKTYKQRAYFESRTIFPPPFRPIYYLAKLFYNEKGRNYTCTYNKKPYYDLLLELIKRRNDNKDKASKEDELSDIRHQDIKKSMKEQENQTKNLFEKVNETENMLHQDIKKMIGNQEIQIQNLSEKVNEIENMFRQDIKNLYEKASKTESMLEKILLKMDNLQND